MTAKTTACDLPASDTDELEAKLGALVQQFRPQGMLPTLSLMAGSAFLIAVALQMAHIASGFHPASDDDDVTEDEEESIGILKSEVLNRLTEDERERVGRVAEALFARLR